MKKLDVIFIQDCRLMLKEFSLILFVMGNVNCIIWIYKLVYAGNY